MILAVASNRDIAGLNIAKQLLKHYNFKEEQAKIQQNPVHKAEINGNEVRLIFLNDESIHAQHITALFPNPELIIFISRHSSESGTPTLSVHVPGNLGEAQLGGLPRKVSIAPANAMRDTLKAMTQQKEELSLAYDVSYECTHHGPSLDAPAMFAELGSSPEQWNDPKAAEAVAHAVINAIGKFGKSTATAALGIGGTHYNAKFTRLALNSETAFGHIIPKYAIPYTDEEIIRQCLNKTLEKAALAILDWKGIKSQDKPRLTQTLTNIGIQTQKT